MPATAATVSETDGRCVHPAFEMLEERAREVRHAFADGRHAAEQVTGKAVRRGGMPVAVHFNGTPVL